MPLKKKGGATKGKGGTEKDQDIVSLEAWAIAQKVTFTAWMNENLKRSGVKVKDLFTDLEDGLILIRLMEVLSGKKMHEKYHSKPSRSAHRNQNLNTVFAFMTDVEHLPITDITPSHIVEHDYKQILTLIWHLIVHYHITETSQGSKTLLLDWFSTSLPENEIFNFTTSWRDGRNLSALVNYCDPSLIPDIDSLDPKNAHENMKTAMKLAEDKLGVPQIITPDDLMSDRQDERSIMLYLSYFVREGSPGQRRILQWIQEKIPEENVANLSTAWVDGKALGALTHTLSDGGFDVYREFKAETAVENCKQAMEAAENLLAVDQTMKPEEFANPEFNTIIRSTYLTQFLYSISRPKVFNMHIPDQDDSSGTPFVDIICPEEITGEVEAYVKSTSAGRLQAIVESTGERQYRVSFVGDYPEIYTLTVSVGGKRVKGSPFTFNLTRPDPNAVKHVNTILPTKAGIPALLLFDMAEAGIGKLTCSVVGETTGEVRNSAEQMSPTSSKVSFFPWENDTYTVDVNFNGQPVAGSPFPVIIDNLLQPERAVVGKPEVTEAGEPVIIPIDVSKAGEASLVVKCVGEMAGEIETMLLTIDGQEKPTGVVFTPPFEDVYTISIVFGNTEIDGSPITIDLIPPPPDSKKVRLTKPPSGVLDPGQLIVIGFDTSKAGKGEMEAVCMGKKIGELEVQVKEVSKNNYEVSFTPPSMDDYTLEVNWGGGKVPGSPFTLNLVSKDFPNPNNVKVIGFPTPKDILIVDEEICFQVDTKDAGKGVLKVTVEIDEPVKKSEQNDRAHLAKEEQSNSVSSSVSGEKDSAKEGVTKQAEQEESKEEEGSGAPAPPPSSPQDEDKLLDQQDKQENQEQQDSVAAAKQTPGLTSPGPSAPEPVVEQSEDNPRLYNVTYKPNVSGRHTVNISWAGDNLPSFPKVFSVVQPRTAHLGSPIKVELKTSYKRKHLKVRAVSRKDNKEFKVRMDKIATGHYVLIFQPKEPGIYLLHVATKEKKLEDSPYVINYTKVIEPQEAKVFGLGEQGYVGEPIVFTIDAQHAEANEVAVYRQLMGSIHSFDSSLTQEGEVISLHVKINDDGTYSAVYTPTVPGEESLDVRVAGVPVVGSPFPISILTKEDETADSSPELPKAALGGEKKSKKKDKGGGGITGFGLDSERFLVGSTQKFKLHCEELGEGELEVTSKPQSAAEIDVTTTTGENSYWVEITPKKAGKHDIIVRYGGKHISGSPFRVQFLSRGDALKCSMVDALPDCPTEVDNNVVFCISTKGAGKGKLRATSKSITSEKEVPVTVTHVHKHHYHVLFPPTEGLNYTLSVFYDELHIQGSPFRIALGDASRCRTSGDGLVKAWSTKWNKFTIDSEEAGPGELSVVIEGEGSGGHEGENNRIEPNISQLNDFHHEVAYQPFEVGNYWITVRWGDIEIPGSPFCVPCRKPLTPSQFVIEEVVTQTFLGKPAQITVNCNEVIEEDDKMTISVHSAQDERHQGQVTRNTNNQSYTCTITPPNLGRYQVYILWDEKHIPESPFDIENIPVPDAGQFRIEAAESEREVIAMKVHGPRYVFRYGELSAIIKSTSTGEDTPVTITRNTYEGSLVQFKPVHGKGEHLVKIMYDDKDIQGSPFTLVSTDASQCYAKGKGIQKAVTNKWNKFAVFTENGGPGELRIEIEGKRVDGDEDDAISLEPLVTAASETRYDVSYSPTVPGLYKISVFWDLHQIPGSPFNVYFCDPNRYTIHKPPKDGILGKPINVAISELSTPPDQETLEIFATSKEHQEYKGEVKRGNDGSCIASVQPLELGKYVIHIRCNGYEIQGSPFKTKMMPPPVAEKVAVSGPGVQDGNKVGEPSNFTVDVSEAGHGYMTFQVQGPKHAFKINLQQDQENKDIIRGEYNPTHPGTYIVALMWSGVHVPNSPFTIKVEEADAEVLSYQPEDQTGQENE